MMLWGQMRRRSLVVARPLSTRLYNSLADADVSRIEAIVGKAGIVTDAEALQQFNADWTGEFKGRSRLAVRPASTEELAEVMRYLHGRNIASCPQGGNTGLVGGSVPVNDEVIVSMRRMNKILDFDKTLGAISCQAGVTLQSADEFARSHGHVMPLDLGSKGSCQVGGNLATNAGGIRLIRYGSLRGNVLGLQVVLSDGTILDSMRLLRKDNVGYDLKQLFVGSEGTLGVITACTLLTPSKPACNVVALLGLSTFQDAIEALRLAKSTLGQSLSAFEYFDQSCIRLVTATTKLRNPLDTSMVNFYVVIELSGQDEGQERERLLEYISRMRDGKLVRDGVLSENERQFSEIWSFRELITSSLRSSGMRVFKYDVSLPAIKLNEATQYVADHLTNKSKMTDVQVFQYGHLGDGNLHFNAACPSKDQVYVSDVQREIEKALYGYVKNHHGSISAEHGLGALKANKILYSRSQVEVDWMKHIKRTFDPKGLLNPNKVLL